MYSNSQGGIDSNITKLLSGHQTQFLRLNCDSDDMPTVHLLDYAAGNIRSLKNAIKKLGWEVAWIESPDDVAKAEVSKVNIFLMLSHADR